MRTNGATIGRSASSKHRGGRSSEGRPAGIKPGRSNHLTPTGSHYRFLTRCKGGHDLTNHTGSCRAPRSQHAAQSRRRRAAGVYRRGLGSIYARSIYAGAECSSFYRLPIMREPSGEQSEVDAKVARKERGSIMSAEVIKLSARRKPRVEPMMLPAAFIVAYLAVAVVMIDIVRESFASAADNG